MIVATTGGEPIGTRVALGRVGERRSCWRVGKPHYVPDVDADARYCRYLGEEMKSELAVPLISGETVLGVLNLESPAPGFFTAEHAQILQALAGQAAVAVERARRFEVERLAAIGGLAGDIVHRLNNPLGALSGWVDLLKRKDFYGELIEKYPYVEQFVGRARTRHQAREVDRPGTAGGAEAPRPCAGDPAGGDRRGASCAGLSRLGERRAGACRRGPARRAGLRAGRAQPARHLLEPARQRGEGHARRRHADVSAASVAPARTG